MLLHLLDTPHLEIKGQRLDIMPTKPSALMLYLAAQGDWIDREQLATMFAPQHDESSARHHLRVLLNRARGFAWTGLLEAEPTRLRFLIPTDLKAFREAIGRGDHEVAIELHRKPLLQGFYTGISEFETWAELEREAFTRAWREAAQKQAKQLSSNDPAAAAQILLRVLEQDDLSEDVLAAYLENAYLAGQTDNALRAFEQFKNRLQLELNLEPMNATTQLADQIRQRKPLNPTIAISGTVPTIKLQPTRLIGRRSELEQLQSSLSAITFVTAEPGAGKTRFLEEALPEASWLRCIEGLESLPYQSVIELLQQRISQIPDLAAYNDDLARLIPDLLPNRIPNPIDPSSAKTRLLEALARALESIATTLVFDDLQWADSSTLELIVFLAHRKKIRIVGAYRSNEVSLILERTLSSLNSSNELQTIHLIALNTDTMRELLADLIGIQTGPFQFAKWLTMRSGGNVFFALETLKSLFENGVLTVRDGDWHTSLDEITKDYSELEVPDMVAQLIYRRFARLPDATQRALSAASVMAGYLNAKWLATLTGLSELAVIEAFEIAEENGFLKNDGFSHDLFRQCLYQQLPKRRREFLHAQIADLLQDHAEPLVISDHLKKSNQFERAWNLELIEAKRQFERGLLGAGFEILDSVLKQASLQDSQRLEALILSGTYMLFLDLDASDEFFKEVLNTPQVPANGQLRAFCGLTENAVYRGDMQVAEQYVLKALQQIQPETASELRQQLGFARLEVMLRSGKLSAADALLPEVYALEPHSTRTATYEAQLRYYQAKFHDAVRIFERIRSHDPNSVYLYTLENDLAVSYWWTGNLEKAEKEAQLSLTHWQNSPHVEALSRMHMGFIRLSQGRFLEALDYMREAKNDSIKLGSLTYQGDIEQRFGVIYFHAGQFDTALVHLHRALELMRRVGDSYREAMILGVMVGVYASKGDIPRSQQYVLEAEKPIIQSQNLAAQHFLSQAKSIICLHKGQLQEARAYNTEVEAFARSTGLPEFLCFVLLLKAKLEPDPIPILTEALEIAITRGYKMQEFMISNALGDIVRAADCLAFLREHAPENWFYSGFRIH